MDRPYGSSPPGPNTSRVGGQQQRQRADMSTRGGARGFNAAMQEDESILLQNPSHSPTYYPSSSPTTGALSPSIDPYAPQHPYTLGSPFNASTSRRGSALSFNSVSGGKEGTPELGWDTNGTSSPGASTGGVRTPAWGGMPAAVSNGKGLGIQSYDGPGHRGRSESYDIAAAVEPYGAGNDDDRNSFYLQDRPGTLDIDQSPLLTSNTSFVNNESSRPFRGENPFSRPPRSTPGAVSDVGGIEQQDPFFPSTNNGYGFDVDPLRPPIMQFATSTSSASGPRHRQLSFSGSSYKSSLRNPVPSAYQNGGSTTPRSSMMMTAGVYQSDSPHDSASAVYGPNGQLGPRSSSIGIGYRAPSQTSSNTGLLGSSFTMSKHILMAEHIFRKGLTLGWFPEQHFGVVAVRSKVGKYETFPPAEEVEGIDELIKGITGINCEVATVLTSNVVRTVIDAIPEDRDSVPIKDHKIIQVLDTLDELTLARRNQHAAFIRSDRSMVVWSDNVATLESIVQGLDEDMINFVWDGKAGEVWEPEAEIVTETEKRKVNKLAPILIGLATGLNILICSLTIRTLIIEYLTDGAALRLVILASIPFEFCVLQFFCSAVINVFAQIIAPVQQLHENSRYFSGKAPVPISNENLPHFTIQLPVYKESLEGVLKPTVESVKIAMKTYELQGGSASLLVCDDGMQLLDERELAIRKEWYDKNSISYVARPAHGEHFNRAGRFKKASNLNYTLELSLRVEELMRQRRPDPRHNEGMVWTNDQEEELYSQAVEEVIASTRNVIREKITPPELQLSEKPKGRKAIKEWKEKKVELGRMVLEEKDKEIGAWVSGNIRIGEFILLIDADTRVPSDCFLDAASEMAYSPDVAIIQHYSEVMFVVNHFFENGIAYFTRLVNLSISWICANGDVSPFVGHNAFLRWSALQEVAATDKDGRRVIWSESHVSEDFDMALRLLRFGYLVRWATYSKGGFKEGVSLTAQDELNRWQKYAFGVSELVFQPFRRWYRGPITGEFIRFLWSNLPLHYKFSCFGYTMSYYAIGVAWPLAILNYALYGLFIPTLDQAYVPAWNISLGLLVVFSAASSVAFATLRYRSGDADLFWSFAEQFMWLPFFLVFFGGLSIHISMALLAHMCSINMTWSATVKDAFASNLWNELPGLFKRFWVMLLFFILIMAGIIIESTPLVPMEWQIIDWVAIVPMCLVIVPHILYPIVLNPYMMRFRF